MDLTDTLSATGATSLAELSDRGWSNGWSVRSPSSRARTLVCGERHARTPCSRGCHQRREQAEAMARIARATARRSSCRRSSTSPWTLCWKRWQYGRHHLSARPGGRRAAGGGHPRAL